MADIKPGGEYIREDGRTVVNAKGERIGEVKDGKVVSADGAESAPAADDPWTTFPGRKALEAEGLKSITAVAAKTDEEILKVNGIGPALLADILAHPAFVAARAGAKA